MSYPQELTTPTTSKAVNVLIAKAERLKTYDIHELVGINNEFDGNLYTYYFPPMRAIE